MIYVTGDIHGEIDIHRLNSYQFPQQRHMGKGDYVVICGDFGCVWAGDQTDRYWLNWLEAKPFTTLFVDGNHENFPLLAAYPQRTWQGGLVHELRPSVLHLMRGQVFSLEGRRFFTMGGASSHDRAYRVEGKSCAGKPGGRRMAGGLCDYPLRAGSGPACDRSYLRLGPADQLPALCRGTAAFSALVFWTLPCGPAH